jgi:hypothetical protein
MLPIVEICFEARNTEIYSDPAPDLGDPKLAPMVDRTDHHTSLRDVDEAAQPVSK